MKLRMLTSMSGTLLTLNRGDITEAFTDKEAARLIKAGFAEPVGDEPAVVLAALSEDMKVLSEKHDVAEQALAERDTELSDARKEIAALRSALDEAEAELVTLGNERNALKDEVAKLAAAQGEKPGGSETADKPKAPEKRG